MEIRGVKCNPEELEERISNFNLRARKLIHLGEVSYKEGTDPLSIAVSQTFKIEKNFAKTDLGCTQSVADAINPKLGELNLELHENTSVKIAGFSDEMMTYYIIKKPQN